MSFLQEIFKKISYLRPHFNWAHKLQVTAISFSFYLLSNRHRLRQYVLHDRKCKRLFTGTVVSSVLQSLKAIDL